MRVEQDAGLPKLRRALSTALQYPALTVIYSRAGDWRRMSATVVQDEWADTGDEPEESSQIDEYDLAAAPNDFNVSTIVDFIASGAVKIPGFQRNYVWDIKRASRLIESLIIGLPVPQVFLYEEQKNSFLVIDGQQRLMTIYYFVRGRFPRKEKRVEIRTVFDAEGVLPDAFLANDEFFENFNLRLPEVAPGVPNRFHLKNYQTLDEYKFSFNLRTIRNMIVKQVKPSGDDSSIYEMFNRLNTGGVLLTPQEIRSSLYHSKFYDELFMLNLEPQWRELLGQPQADLHMRDIEVLLRGIAVWRDESIYAPSMVKFLNQFSTRAKQFSDDDTKAIVVRVKSFLDATRDVPRKLFLTRQGKFSVPFFEAVFAAVCLRLEEEPSWTLDPASVGELAVSDDFAKYSQEQTTDTSNVKGRLRVAREILTGVVKGDEGA